MPPRARPPRIGKELAAWHNETGAKAIEKRAAAADAVLHACLTSYKAWLEAHPSEPLENLTHHLISTAGVTAASIRERMELRYVDDPRGLESAVTNSLRRSAGTNYQSLVSYALARHLLSTGSHWYVVFPVPSSFGYSLGIKFGLPDEDGAYQQQLGDATESVDDALAGGVGDDEPVEGRTQEDTAAEVVVKPDLDILLKNASWEDSDERNEPVLVLSVKTSLADRAGSAARWKTYFDLVTKPCSHLCEEDCAYRQLGISLNHPLKVDITHGIVTANIYKINSDEHFTKYGELGSNQAKSNTFMFDRRYTTRTDNEDVMAPGWASLTQITLWLNDTSERYGLPA